jgi:hypothetical protein
VEILFIKMLLHRNYFNQHNLIFNNCPLFGIEGITACIDSEKKSEERANRGTQFEEYVKSMVEQGKEEIILKKEAAFIKEKKKHSKFKSDKSRMKRDAKRMMF